MSHTSDVKATRKAWEVTTYADGHGIWHCKVIPGPAGWGNGSDCVHNATLHIDAARARARRAIRKEILARQSNTDFTLRLTISRVVEDHMGVIRLIEFKEA